jgi:hypothetical protein
LTSPKAGVEFPRPKQTSKKATTCKVLGTQDAKMENSGYSESAGGMGDI